jgi:hypothetical protein
MSVNDFVTTELSTKNMKMGGERGVKICKKCVTSFKDEPMESLKALFYFEKETMSRQT